MTRKKEALVKKMNSSLQKFGPYIIEDGGEHFYLGFKNINFLSFFYDGENLKIRKIDKVNFKESGIYVYGSDVYLDLLKALKPKLFESDETVSAEADKMWNRITDEIQNKYKSEYKIERSKGIKFDKRKVSRLR